MTIRSWRPLRHFAVLLLALTAVVSPDLAGQGRRARASVMIDGREAVDGEVLVRFRNAAAAYEQARAEDEVEADEVEPVGRRGTRRMRARRLGTRDMLARLRANPDVDFVEPNYIIRLVATPNDPSFGNLWGLFNFGQNYGGAGIAGADIDATQAWDLSTGTRANIVGIVDTGIDYNHPDLAANIWTAPSAFSVTVGGVVINCAAGTHGFNAITNTCDPMDDNNHGTHVAGTIGAVGNNGVGVAGVNWTASMMGLKFLGSNGSGTTANAIKAIEFAVQAKAVLGTATANVRVLSNSWGGGGYSQSLLDEINRANTFDMLFVAAAGNDGVNADVFPMYPAAYSAPNIISVAATDNRDQRAGFSNYGAATVHLGAPGVAILSTTRNNTYAAWNGTSMATPQVSGAAALLLSSCGLTTAQLKNALLTAVDPVAALASITTTGGRLNVNRALRACAVTVTVDSVTPSSGTGVSQTFTLQYSDSAGAADLNAAYVWFNADTASVTNSCLAYYSPATGRLNLLNAAGTAWISGVIGSVGATIENSACALALGSSTATAVGATLTLSLPVTFKPVFSGAKNVYMYAAGITGAASGPWSGRGSWTVLDTRVTPTVTWAAPGGITYGTPLSTAQLNATAAIPGAFVYTPPAGTVLGGGAGQVLSVTFYPTDTSSYTTATATVPITVARATPVVTWPAPANVTSGTLLSVTQLNATVPGVAGTFVYTPPAGTALGLGSHTLSVTFTPANSVNYTNATKTVPFTVVAAPATAVSADSVTPNTGSGAGQTFVLQYSDVTGAANLIAAYVWFNANTASSTNSCLAYYSPATGRVSLLNDAGTAWTSDAIGGGTTLQNGACAVALGSSTAVINGPTLTLSLPVTFTPGFAGAKNIYLYAANVGLTSGGWQSRGTWTVADTRTTPALTWSAPAAITFGTPLSATQLNAGASVAGAFVYTPPAGTVLGGGAGQVLSVTFYPADTVSYTAATATVPITVARATPVVTWPAPTNVTSGTPLGATQLNATVPGVAGTFVYTPPAGTALGLGSHTLSVTFTPANSVNYTAATKTVPFTVVAAPATPVSADSVTPNTGSGAAQTFVLQYSDATGAANLTAAYVWFNANTASSANSCLAYYSPATGRVSLLNDAGTAWLTAPIGSPATLQNSACAIAIGSSTATASGTTLTLTLRFTFATGFAGAKNTYMYAANNAGVTSGSWQSRGGWSVP